MKTWKIYGVSGELIDTTDCDESTLLMTNHSGGLGLPGVLIDSVPGRRRAGSRRGPARKLDRLIVLPLRIKALPKQDMAVLVEYLARALDPEWGDCRIVVGREDGSERDIVATYSSGLQPTFEYQRNGKVKAKATITFRAHDPYWRSTTELNNSLVFPVSGSGASLTGWDDLGTLWDEPGMPWDGFQATDAAATARTDVVVACTAPVWPRWEIRGPGTRVELHNAAAGATFVWEGNLPDGAQMSIDFDESRRHVRINGSNAWSGLADQSEFWQLKPGNGADAPQRNPVFAQVVGSDSTTRCEMIYRPAFLSP